MDIALLIAIAGLALGIYNTWQNHMENREKIIVFFKRAIPIYDNIPNFDQEHIVFEIVNESNFAVEVKEVGFYLNGIADRCVLTRPNTSLGESLPLKVEPKCSKSLHFTYEIGKDIINNIDRPYARTATNKKFYAKT